MNLVAKEYCASSVDGNGVLILSEFAGAADQLGRGALLVNPYDIEGRPTPSTRASPWTSRSASRRMTLLQTDVRRNDVHRWVGWFLDTMQSGGPAVAFRLWRASPGPDGSRFISCLPFPGVSAT